MHSSYINQFYTFELNTRIFCLDHHCTLEQLPDWFFNSPEVQAADCIWFMGIWKPSFRSVEICKSHEGLRGEFLKCLPDLHENDILGSPYSIYEYTPNPIVSKGFERIRRVKERLNKMGKKLILDFVPNHMSVDTIYLEKNPDLFLHKPAGESVCQNSFFHEPTGRVYYYGRDPYFDGWTDTVQWDFSHPGVLEFHKEILSKIAYICDGVRCDMAMLPEADIFHRTHGKYALEYWRPLIQSVKDEYPDFLFMGEVYWNREYDLQQKGFDYTYDKTLYDRLKIKDAKEIKSHLDADLDYQKKSIRFLENHDEERAYHVFGNNSIPLFSLLSFIPGMILYYEGQSIGATKKVPVQLGRAPLEDLPYAIKYFYERAFGVIQSRKNKELEYLQGNFNSYEAIGYNPLITHIILSDSEYPIELLFFNPEDRIISGWFRLQKKVIEKIIQFDFEKIYFKDITNDDIYEFDKNDIIEKGMYIKLEPFQSHWLILNT